MEPEVFVASRWTRGNRIFPTAIMIGSNAITRIKPRLFGRDESTMNIAHIASVTVRAGILWADVLIESTGGAAPVFSHGHWKKDAQRIRELIEQHQRQLREEQKEKD